MKAIKLQIEMLYHIPDELAEDVYWDDVEHFRQIGVMFNNWAVDPKEVREPIDFDFRHSIGEVIDEEE